MAMVQNMSDEKLSRQLSSHTQGKKEVLAIFDIYTNEMKTSNFDKILLQISYSR